MTESPKFDFGRWEAALISGLRLMHLRSMLDFTPTATPNPNTSTELPRSSDGY
jgi:hypothetical protein